MRAKNTIASLITGLFILCIIGAGLWYITSPLCLTDDKSSFHTCETTRASIISISIAGLYIYRVFRTLKQPSQLAAKTSSQSQKSSTTRKNTHTLGFLLCTLPALLILLSLLDLGNGYARIFTAILGFIGWLAIIPGFIAGIVLITRSKQ